MKTLFQNLFFTAFILSFSILSNNPAFAQCYITNVNCTAISSIPSQLTDTDCDDSNACTEDSCSGTPKKCSHQKLLIGCTFENNCIPVSTRVNDKFCHIDATILNQKDAESNCNNNYECSSNLCIDSVCIEPGLFNKLIQWFNKLF